MSEPEDEREQLRQRREAALAELFLKYRDRLERIVTFRIDPRIRGRIDAADILQEAYLDIAARLEMFLESTDVSFFVWLRQRTLQTLIDVHRRHFRHKRDAGRDIQFVSSSMSDGTSLSIASFLADQASSPSQAMVREEEMQWLQEALNGMTRWIAKCWLSRHFEQLGNSQVAEILGITPQPPATDIFAPPHVWVNLMARFSSKDRSLGQSQ